LDGLASAPQPTLRWYSYTSPALILGSGQKLSDVDLAALGGTTVHRRRSGGTAVLFEPGLLMQDIALPVGHPLYSHDVTASYRWLGELWVVTLADLGIAAQTLSIAEARSDTASLEPLLRRACFGGRSPYEVLAEERKLVGFSQVRRRGGLVLQVALYERFSAARLATFARARRRRAGSAYDSAHRARCRPRFACHATTGAGHDHRCLRTPAALTVWFRAYRWRLDGVRARHAGSSARFVCAARNK
ncbi:hypothetical protein HC891_10360, partial [Candidatus Gracilibacteria bacterium]|nr:hypothetical protein [Candidatus Gracilibacteria bacterium]